MNYSRFLIAAPHSGSGKTLVTIGLMSALKAQGKKLAAFKCGPDYIDPMFHERVLQIPAKNLDLFFSDENQCRALFQGGNTADISIIEGVMGLYDGLGGVTEEASSYHLAKTLECPIILIINARGMARSLLAEIAGFLSMDTHKLIKGVILNQISGMFYESIKPMIEEALPVQVLGYLPVQKELKLESRYLGLKLPHEVANLEKATELLGQELMKTVDLEKLCQLADQAEPMEEARLPWQKEKSQKDQKPVRIAVARDEAFCFYYEDNLRMLEAYGAELVEFSPVHDQRLPEQVAGLILGGGYPELLAQQLSDNTSMKMSIRGAIKAGMPSLAECGGFMYLHEAIELDENQTYPMLGIIPGKVTNQKKLTRFGYVTVTEKEACFGKSIKKQMLGKETVIETEREQEGLCIRAHEYHYFDSSQNGSDCLAVKPVNGRSWDCCLLGRNYWWGFPHLYYPSNPELVNAFLRECRTYEERM